MVVFALTPRSRRSSLDALVVEEEEEHGYLDAPVVEEEEDALVVQEVLLLQV